MHVVLSESHFGTALLSRLLVSDYYSVHRCVDNGDGRKSISAHTYTTGEILVIVIQVVVVVFVLVGSSSSSSEFRQPTRLLTLYGGRFYVIIFVNVAYTR